MFVNIRAGYWEGIFMQLVDRVLKTIEILSTAELGMSVSDLSEALDIPASSTHRVLKSLQDNHFVTQDADTRKYRLSYKLYSICSGMKEQNSLIMLARPYMRMLAEEISKPVVLCVLSGEKIINLDCIENSNASVYMVKTGEELPLYSTSAGRVFAADMQPEKARKILEKEPRYKATPYTKTDVEELEQELARIRVQGYSVIDEELQLGIQGVSCPIRDYRGKIVAALAATTVKSENSITDELIDRLKYYAGEISGQIL